MKKPLKSALFFLFLILGLWACEEDLQPQPQPQPQNKLLAQAGADQQVRTDSLVILDGAASKDGNGKPFTFAWAFKSKPDSSTASLKKSATVSPEFTPDVAGTYVVELLISNARDSATDEVKIVATTPNNGPGPEPNEPTTIIISEDITEDRVLEDIFTDGAIADYIVTADVSVYARLTVKPGVKIHFEENKGLIIAPEGVLIAKGVNDGSGSTEKMISFIGKNNTKGYWKGILLMSSHPLNEMEYVSIENGGSSPFAEISSSTSSNLILLSTNNATPAAINISNSLFYSSGGYGILVLGESELKKFENNYFENNAEAAMYVPARQLHKLDFFSHFTGNNGFNGVETGGSLNLNEVVSWPDFNDGSGYLVSSDIILESGVSIHPGASFKFLDSRFIKIVEGAYLDASGTEANKITFTASTPTPANYWGGIIYHSVSEMNKLHYTEVSYAGNVVIPNYDGLSGNVVITTNGQASVEHSELKHGLGWGLIAYTDKGALVNAAVHEANSFESFPLGNVKLTSGDLNQQQLAGEWLNEESFINKWGIDDKFYDQAANLWFRGAGSPEAMEPRAGYGLKIDASGNYLWTITEPGPVAGCGTPYSAEYIVGKVTVDGNQLHFQESYWRSMFYNPCDESQSVDTNITPGNHTLNYNVETYYDLWTGNPILELSLFLSDGSVIKYHKR